MYFMLLSGKTNCMIDKKERRQIRAAFMLIDQCYEDSVNSVCIQHRA
jgi:hypothetical protein